MDAAGNQEMVRINNQKLILNLIKERGLISRADIAKVLDLSPPSTSSNINQLLKADLVREVGEGESIGGRKPILLELNREYGFIISIDMSGRDYKVALGNIYAEIVDSVDIKRRNDDTGIGLIIDLINNVNSLIKKNGIEKDKIKIILIAAHGIIDKSCNRLIAYNDSAEWNDIDIIKVLQMEFKTEVVFKECYGIAAFGEYRFGVKQKYKSLLYVYAGEHISAGIIINGELYEGAGGAAGIIGKSVFSKEQVGGIYKRNGYLETIVSTSKLIQRIKNSCRNDKSLLELCGGNINKLDFNTLKRAYEKDNMAVKNELDRVVDHIAMTIANINSLLNLDIIVLGGEMATLGEYYIISIKKTIGEVCPFTPYIVYSTLKDNSTTYGALAAGQQYMLDDIIR